MVLGLLFSEMAVESVFAPQLHHYDFSINLLPIYVQTLVLQEVSHLYLHSEAGF